MSSSEDRKFRRKHGLYYFLADVRVITLVDKMHVKKDKKSDKLVIRNLTTKMLRRMIAEELEKQAEKIRNVKDLNAIGYVVEKSEAEAQVKSRNQKKQ